MVSVRLMLMHCRCFMHGIKNLQPFSVLDPFIEGCGELNAWADVRMCLSWTLDTCLQIMQIKVEIHSYKCCGFLVKVISFCFWFFLILKNSLLFILEGIINTIWPYIFARNLRFQLSFLCMKQSLEILLWPHLIPLWFSWIKKWNLIETRLTLLSRSSV